MSIAPSRIIVIYGQGGVDAEGNVIGETIEEQTRTTLEDCRTQLAAAGGALGGLFKLTGMGVHEWPVRIARGVRPLSFLKLEVEMWAVRGK